MFVKTYSLKNLLYPMAIVILIGCSYSARHQNAVEDSLAYYPPTPKALPKAEFRHYYNLFKDHFETQLLNRCFSGPLLIAKTGVTVFETSLGFADTRTNDTLTEQ